MTSQMTVTYSKVTGAPAVHRWPGGLVATTMPSASADVVPHDLGHWIMEVQIDLPWGFWALAGQQAPFASFTLVSGRWPKGKQEWLDRVRRKHGPAMLHAEAHGGHWLTDADLDVRAQWHEIRPRLVRSYAFEDNPLLHLGPEDVERMHERALRLAQLWADLPTGGSIEVRWPDDTLPVVVPTDTRGVGSVPASHLASIPGRAEKADSAVKARRSRQQRERARPRRR
jgi:hypothetical protein